MKKVLLIVLALLMTATLLAACGGTPASSGAPESAAPESTPDATAEPSTEGHYTFGFSVPTMNNPFFLTIHDAAKETIEGNGDTFIAGDPQMDPQKQISQIEDMLIQGIDVMVLCPIDSASIKTALTACNDKGVPVIIYDTPVHDDELVVTTVASDNVNAGYVAGIDMMTHLPEGSTVAIMHSPAAQACVERVEGFMKATEGYFEIVATYDGQGDTGVTMPIAEDVLQGNPDLGGFFAVNDPSAIGCVQAIEAAGRTGNVVVYGVDGQPMAKAAIKEGTMQGTGAQSPINLGKIAVEKAYAFLKGETVEKDTVVETFIINADNVDDFEIDGWQ